MRLSIFGEGFRCRLGGKPRPLGVVRTQAVIAHPVLLIDYDFGFRLFRFWQLWVVPKNFTPHDLGQALARCEVRPEFVGITDQAKKHINENA
jgi:hypothetical protein